MDEVNLKNSNIEGLIIQPLKQIIDERGSVMHMLRSDSPVFKQFGEIYFSTIKHGVIKAWKKHKYMTQNIAVPVGKIKVVIFDDRVGSRTYGNLLEIRTGTIKYSLIIIPPKVWYGFEGLSSFDSLIANCTTLPFDEKEVERVESVVSFIPYIW